MENLNVEEIKKALECCRYGGRCAECPCFEIPNCQALANNNALALIKSQEQRIKELTEENERLRENYKPPIARNIDILKATTKADTIREFAERVKEYYSAPTYQPTKEHPIKHTQIEYLFSVIDQIAKELAGAKRPICNTISPANFEGKTKGEE